MKNAAFGALVAAFPNTGFMGVPLLVALLGERAAGLLSAAKVTRFVCGQCGFTEEWIESPADLELLRKRFGE